MLYWAFLYAAVTFFGDEMSSTWQSSSPGDHLLRLEHCLCVAKYLKAASEIPKAARIAQMKVLLKLGNRLPRTRPRNWLNPPIVTLTRGSR